MILSVVSVVDSPNDAVTSPTLNKELVVFNSVSTKFQQCVLVWHLIYFTTLRLSLLIKNDLGSLLHLTRQHWISLFSLILPGNDDDGCLLTSDPDLSVSVSWNY